MSGAVIKTFSILSFLLLVGGMVALAPGADAEDIYIEDGSGTADDPFSGVVFLNPEDHYQEDVYVLAGTEVYVFVDTGTVSYYCDEADPSTFEGYDNDLTDGTPDTVPGFGGTEYTVTSVLGLIPSGVSMIVVADGGSDMPLFGIAVVEDSDSGSSGSGGSGDGESGSGSDSGDSGGSSSDGDQSSADDDNSDGSDEDFSDSSAVERQSSPVLAILILIAGAILIWWVVKKVRD